MTPFRSGDSSQRFEIALPRSTTELLRLKSFRFLYKTYPSGKSSFSCSCPFSSVRDCRSGAVGARFVKSGPWADAGSMWRSKYAKANAIIVFIFAPTCLIANRRDVIDHAAVKAPSFAIGATIIVGSVKSRYALVCSTRTGIIVDRRRRRWKRAELGALRCSYAAYR